MSAHDFADCSSSSLKKKSPPLAQCVKESLETYLDNLEGQKPVNLYQMVIEEIEKSLLTTVLHYTKNNQCNAAAILGISRGTLRKKLKLNKLHLKS
jgi:Fis family transcriptional regulator, factor for inversion stimulation protein